MGLTLSLDLDLLITFSESLGLFVPYSSVKISAYDGFGSLHCCQRMPLRVGFRYYEYTYLTLLLVVDNRLNEATRLSCVATRNGGGRDPEFYGL